MVSNKSKRQGGPLPPSLRNRMIKLQLRSMERSLEPVKLEFNTRTIQGIHELHEKLGRLLLDRKITPGDFQAFNNMVANELKILLPSELEMRLDELLQQTKATREDIAGLKRARPDNGGGQ